MISTINRNKSVNIAYAGTFAEKSWNKNELWLSISTLEGILCFNGRYKYTQFDMLISTGIADIAEDETCDTHLIEQTDKGYRCAIDVPSVLYK